MHPDQEDAHPWLREVKALLGELLERGTPLLGVCLGGQLLADAVGPPLPPRERAGDRLVRGGADARGGAGSGARRRWPRASRRSGGTGTSSTSPAAEPRSPAAPACLQAYRLGDAAWGIQFHAEVTGEDADAWIDDDREKEDAARIVGDFDELRERTRAAIGPWNELGRGLCERFLDAAATRA